MRLFDELGELTAAKELSHGRHDGTNVDQRVGCRLSRFRNAHSLFDNAFHTQQADAELRLDQFPNAAHAAVAQVVNVIWASVFFFFKQKTAYDIDDVIQGQDVVSQWDGEVEFL